MAAAGTEQLRRLNTALVLRTLRDQGPASRALVAQRTGLAKATVSAIATRLLALSAVTEAPGSPGGSSGRPGRPLRLDGATVVGLGMEVNVGYVAATALDLAGRPVLSAQVPSTTGDELETLQRMACRWRAELHAQGREVIGVDLAVPGLVDRDRGVVVAAPNLGWHDLDLAGAVSAALASTPVQDRPPADLPDADARAGADGPVDVRIHVRIDNDANYAALAESTYGVGHAAGSVLYLTGTAGLGAGLVVEGRVQRGAHGFAGEVGHLPVGGSSLPCACGRTGCWETTVGLRAVARAAGAQPLGGDRTDPLAVAEQVAARAAHDPRVRAAVAKVAAALGAGLVTLAGVLDPAVVVLGGSFVPLGPLLVPDVEHALDAGLLGSGARRCVVALSTLGLRAASTGAAADVLADVFDGRSPLA